MEFLTILIVLGLLQLWGSGGPVQQDGWFKNMAQRIANTVLKLSWLRLLLIIGIPVVVVMFFQMLFDSVLLGLLSLLLNVGVLLYSLGRGDFSENIQRYLSSWNHGNFESAYEQALQIGNFEPSDEISDHISLHQHVRSAILYGGFERWFSVVFWFLLLGPAGAIFYRLTYLCSRNDILATPDRQFALQIMYFLDWIPVRLLAICFSLTGNFVNSFNHCWRIIFEPVATIKVLESCSLAAISSSDEQKSYPEDQQQFIKYGREELLALQSLLSRSIVCWLVIIAVITLASG